MFNLKKREKDSENEKWIRASHSFEVQQPKNHKISENVHTHRQSPPQNHYFAKSNCHVRKHHDENWIPCAAFPAACEKCVLGRPEPLHSTSGSSQRIVIYFSICAGSPQFLLHLVPGFQQQRQLNVGWHFTEGWCSASSTPSMLSAEMMNFPRLPQNLLTWVLLGDICTTSSILFLLLYVVENRLDLLHSADQHLQCLPPTTLRHPH